MIQMKNNLINNPKNKNNKINKYNKKWYNSYNQITIKQNKYNHKQIINNYNKNKNKNKIKNINYCNKAQIIKV